MAIIKIKRGTTAPGTTLQQGELGFDTVAKELYVGNGIGVAASPVVMEVDEYATKKFAIAMSIALG